VADGEALLAEGNKSGKLSIDCTEEKSGWTALGLACSKGHNLYVAMLLKNGANVNKCSSLDRDRPLW
jgi:ankyrin repeat protein